MYSFARKVYQAIHTAIQYFGIYFLCACRVKKLLTAFRTGFSCCSFEIVIAMLKIMNESSAQLCSTFHSTFGFNENPIHSLSLSLSLSFGDGALHCKAKSSQAKASKAETIANENGESDFLRYFYWNASASKHLKNIMVRIVAFVFATIACCKLCSCIRTRIYHHAYPYCGKDTTQVCYRKCLCNKVRSEWMSKRANDQTNK